jgi:hypothetical protein
VPLKQMCLARGDHVAESGFVAQRLCDFFDLVGCGAWCEDGGLGREVVRWRALWVGFVSYGQLLPRFGVRDATRHRGQRLPIQLAAATRRDAAGGRRPLPARAAGAGWPSRRAAAELAPGEATAHRPGHVTWENAEDVITRERRVSIDHGGTRGETSGTATVRDHYAGAVGVRWDDPSNAWACGGVTLNLTWPEVTVETASRGSLRTDAERWYLELELDVYEDGTLLRQRRWERDIPRELQ